MRYSLLAAALAVAMGSTSFSASAADNRDQTIAELKAQLEALTAKVAELEERSDAQSDVNIDTAAQLDKLNTGSPKIDTKGGIKLTSADGKFEATVGGRIHFDTYAFDRDLASATGTTDTTVAGLRSAVPTVTTGAAGASAVAGASAEHAGSAPPGTMGTNRGPNSDPIGGPQMDLDKA